MWIRDAAKAVTHGKTREGFLRVRAKIGRVGVHDYKARDLGSPAGMAPDADVRVYRPPEEVFDATSMATFAGVPVTLDHPPVMVDASNWKRFAVGYAGASVERDGQHLVTDLLITDAAAVARAEQGAELSNGYWADFVFGKGVTPGGDPYDALQSNIRGNHVALVEQGRCGPSCRIDPDPQGSRVSLSSTARADAARFERLRIDATRTHAKTGALSAPFGSFGDPALRESVLGDCAASACRCGSPCNGDATMSERETVTIDGISVETTPEGAAALGRIEAALSESRAIHRQDVELRDRELATLRARLTDESALDGRVAERAAVIDAARRVLGTSFEPAGQSSAAIRRAAVAKLLGTERVASRGDDYVTAAFDMLAATTVNIADAVRPDAARNPLAGHLAAGLFDGLPSRDAALTARDTYLIHAWKSQTNGDA